MAVGQLQISWLMLAERNSDLRSTASGLTPESSSIFLDRWFQFPSVHPRYFVQWHRTFSSAGSTAVSAMPVDAEVSSIQLCSARGGGRVSMSASMGWAADQRFQRRVDRAGSMPQSGEGGGARAAAISQGLN